MPFKYTPKIIGDLVGIRHLAPNDYKEIFAVASDPLIWQQHPARDRYKPDEFKAFFDQAINSSGALAVIDTKSGLIIGSSRFHAYSKENNSVEIGWTFLSRKYWGGLYNRELKNLMLNHAFNFVDNVILIVAPNNIRSIRAVEKNGGTPFDKRGEELMFKISKSTFHK